jgi:NAD(P)-dependent dehydrogenase (short-subunit alcohol dehydrogenase family)
MSLFAMFKSAEPTGFGYGSTAEQVTEGLSLAGQTILVTGCNSGIGQEACRVLALRGALVLGTARTKEKAAAACATFPGKAIGYSCELSDPSSVRRCVAAVKADGHRLDAIICNAGIMMLPKLEKSHGYELQFFTNYIGHFMLVTGPARSAQGRRPSGDAQQRGAPERARRGHRVRQPLGRRGVQAVDRIRPIEDRRPALRQRTRAALRRH